MSSDRKPELRRSVTPWGSFSWGYSDVGADIFVGLGLVLGAAAGASNVAFLFAGIVYVCIGLAYTELAATYPVAGGGQYFVYARPRRHFRLHRRLGGVARLHHRHRALFVELRRLFERTAAAGRRAVSSLVALHPRRRADRWAVRAQYHRRSRIDRVQWIRKRARRSERNGDSIAWLSLCLQPQSARSHDADELAHAVRIS